MIIYRMQVLKYGYLDFDGKQWLQRYGLNRDLENAQHRLPR